MIKINEGATDQETFDTVVAALRKQGKGAADDMGLCIYGEPGGIRCAIGHLLGDVPCERKGSVGELIYTAVFDKPRNQHLLNSLQVAHDRATGDAEDDTQWCFLAAKKLHDVALTHGLDPALASAWLQALP